MNKYTALLTVIVPLVTSLTESGFKESKNGLRTVPETSGKFYGGNNGGSALQPRNVVYYYPGTGVYYPVYPGTAGGAYPSYPGGSFGGYNPNGGRGNAYPGQGGGKGPESKDEGQDFGGEGGRIPNAVPVDDEVEVFQVPGSNQGGYPGQGSPGGGYPGIYPGYG